MHLTVNRVGLGDSAQVRESHGKQGHGPGSPAGHGQCRFSRLDGRLELAARHEHHLQDPVGDRALAIELHGAPAESAFGDTEATRVIAGARTLHFAPGTRYSYVNQNFRLLSGILQDCTGRGFAELLRSRVFDPAGMPSALLAADTSAMPDGTQGYEGTPERGFRVAENRILWTGDAGLGAETGGDRVHALLVAGDENKVVAPFGESVCVGCADA